MYEDNHRYCNNLLEESWPPGGEDHWWRRGCARSLEALTAGQVSGPQVHDARVAALCRLHGVRELWTADRDFSRFPGLKVKNPLVMTPWLE
jgi:hypothetical protein